MDLIASTLFSTNAACLPAAHQLLIDLSSSSTLPTNVDSFGRTIADKLLYELSIDTIIQQRVRSEIQISGYLIVIFSGIMEGGVSQTHGILQDIHYINYANGAIGDAFRFNLAQRMMESTDNWSMYTFCQGLVHLTIQYVDFHVPELLEPLMVYDKKLLHSLLIAPSFLACSEIPYSYNYWPEGLQVLLQSGKLPSREALLYACYVNIPESVGLLLSARSFYLGSRHMGAASLGQSIETMSLIVDAFVEERRELQSLAENHLTSEEVASLHLKSHNLLDFQAHRAYELLQASGLTLPDWGNENKGYLAYVSIRDNCAMADFLWHGGYRDVDEMDSEGCTSLMFSQTLGFTDWLISHGADIHRRVCGIPALHLMADNVHLNIWPVCSSGKGILPTFQLLLQDKAQDHCDCPCSSAGCLAITRFLHNALTRDYRTGPRDIFDMIRLLSELISLLEEDPSPHAAFEIIRFFNFEALQLPHTCRHPVQCLSTEDGDCDYSPHLEPCYHWEPRDWEEIDEMQDEWRELISVHEELVARFQIMYETSDLPLCEFLGTIWQGEMLKRSQNDDPPSQEEISRVRELGVIFDEVEDDLSGNEPGDAEVKSDAESS
jgi:hypothetical protein